MQYSSLQWSEKTSLAGVLRKKNMSFPQKRESKAHSNSKCNILYYRRRGDLTTPNTEGGFLASDHTDGDAVGAGAIRGRRFWRG